jgi:O-antigen/teichoic acid export membrane protein
MSVVHTVSKGVIWNTAATVIGKALIFTNVFLVLMHFSVYEYGFSELIMSVVAMGSVVLLPGLTATITADLAVERARGATERMNGIFHQFFFLQLVLGFLIWAVLFFAASPIAVFAGNALAGHFLKIISFTFLMASSSVPPHTLFSS